jgi:UDP-2,3-diacylglucosamine pyrophosphatase LpxH
VAFIGAFEEAVAAEARRREADGIICGHIHHAADRSFDGVHYLNCGDWVESCTAIVESHAGELQVIHWGEPPYDFAHARNGLPVHLQAVPPSADAA